MFCNVSCGIAVFISFYTAGPRIISPSTSNVTILAGTSITLYCTSQGSPPDTFTWRKNSGPIVQSTNITTVTHTNTSAVFRADYSIDNITTSDSGTYTCTVTNPIGTDNKAIIVVVIGMYRCEISQKDAIYDYQCNTQSYRYSTYSGYLHKAFEKRSKNYTTQCTSIGIFHISYIQC